MAVLLRSGIIDRSGKFVEGQSAQCSVLNGEKAFILVTADESAETTPVYITETDLENVITAKAAVFAAMHLLLQKFGLSFSDIRRLHIAGTFGNTMNMDNAVEIGLIPDLPRSRIAFAGNTSLSGAKTAALSMQAYQALNEIKDKVSYVDLLTETEYVEEFKKAMFMPHTDIESFAAGSKE